MDENIQREITRICIDLLQKSAVGEIQPKQHLIVKESDEEGLRQLKEFEAQRPKTKRDALALLLKAASNPDITIEDMIDALEVFHNRSKPASRDRQWVIQLLRELMARENIISSDAIEVATELYVISPQDSQERQEALQYLLALARRRDIPFGDSVEAAHSLYINSPRRSKEKQQAAEMLLEQARWPDTTAAQAEEAAMALCNASPLYSKERSQAVQALIEVHQRPNLSFEDAVALDYYGPEGTINLNYFGMLSGGTKALGKQQMAAKKHMWEAVARRVDLTDEQRGQVETILGTYTHWSLLR